MANYTVTWAIDVEADTPYKAAAEARLIQQDPFSEAIYFEVYHNTEHGEPTGVVTSVDLLLDTK